MSTYILKEEIRLLAKNVSENTRQIQANSDAVVLLLIWNLVLSAAVILGIVLK